jgi:hypothetical protein
VAVGVTVEGDGVPVGDDVAEEEPAVVDDADGVDGAEGGVVAPPLPLLVHAVSRPSSAAAAAIVADFTDPVSRMRCPPS